MKTVSFMGKQYHYDGNYIDDATYIFDFGDGEMADEDGDNMFIHMEYHGDEDRWVTEVWFDDDYLVFTEWTGYSKEAQADIDAIKTFIAGNLL